MSCTTSNRCKIYCACCFPNNNTSPQQTYFSDSLRKHLYWNSTMQFWELVSYFVLWAQSTTEDYIRASSFEMKMLHLAIRVHKSGTLSVTTFSLQPRITSSFEKKNKQTTLVQCVKLLWTHPCTPNQSWILGQSQNRCIQVSSERLQKIQTGESTSPRWERKRPVGSKLNNNLYWNHLRQVSRVVLNIFLKSCLGINFSSKHFAPFFYAFWCIAILDMYK